MMTPAALTSRLVANPTLRARVGARIYAVRPPQPATADYIIWQRIGAQPIETLTGATGNQFDLVQFSIFSTDFDAGEAIALALVDCLDGVPLATGDNPTLQSRRDGGFDAELRLYRQDADFLI